MTWIAGAEKYTSEPGIWIEIDFASGTRKYSVDYLRPVGSAPAKGSVLSLPRIFQSVGDIRRSFQLSNILITFSDIDYEFRTLIEAEGIKNKEVRITLSFIDRSLATESLLIFTGQIFDWEPLDNLRFNLYCEHVFENLDEFYPQKRIETRDYANADGSAIGWIVPVPYGMIAAADGGFGHPSLDVGKGGMLFVDNTVDAEKHLVGLQTAAITVDDVYLNGAVQVDGIGDDYTISTQVIDGFTHTEIHWNPGVQPTVEDRVSADITFGSRGPVEAIYHYLTEFCGYVAGDFNAAAYAAAKDTEAGRGYTFEGALWEARKKLRAILDDWRDELELDIYMNKDGEIVFKYLTALEENISEYTDVLDIMPPYNSRVGVKELRNKITYGYNFHYSKTYYGNFSTYENAASQAKYGGTFEGDFQGLRWIRSAIMAQDIAIRKVIRFMDPPVFDTLIFPLKSYEDDLADSVDITHFQGRGAAGYVKKRFQIRSMEFDLDKFTNKMLLEDVSNFAGMACILGDEGLEAADWLTATDEDKDYFYACDRATGEFSNGDTGKRLLD